MQSVLNRFLQLVLFVWIFSIPTSIAWHYNISAGIVHGTLVDYRIPTIAGSAILGVFLVFLFFISKERGNIEFKMMMRRTIQTALVCTIFFQFSIATYQFFFQKSLFGYIPFGEVDLSSYQIAKGTLLNGSLYKLPYGTTVHPNVLAGFCVMAFLLLLFLKKREKSIAFIYLFGIVVTICVVTQSYTAGIALSIGISLFFIHKHVSSKFLLMATLFVPIVSIILLSLPTSFHLSSSISRRSQLQEIAVSMIKAHPFRGVGWNNFTVEMENYGYVSNTVRFLQPVHNVFLLLVSELGVVGWILLTHLGRKLSTQPTRSFMLLTPLVLIGSLDHYLLTLTTGRLLVSFIVIMLMRYPQERFNSHRVQDN